MSGKLHLIGMKTKVFMLKLDAIITGMRKFRIDQDFLIERWHTTYIMSKLFG